MATTKYRLSFNHPMFSDEERAAAGDRLVPVPKELISEITKLPETELSLCRFLLNKTYGQQEDWVELSLLEMAEGGQIPVMQVKAALDSLYNREILLVAQQD